MIIGSGFSNYSHWGALSPVTFEPDGWRFLIQCWDVDLESWKTHRVTHQLVMRAVRLIAKGEVKGVSARLVAHCRFVMFDVEEADLDAYDVDVVLQVAIHNRVIFY